mmetsp:Transcript_16630/g.30099  ORF Transcript_16630/g.30099 Transcript_16630/m.30099 type:complete len:366 (-) Transcript_16630:581-1678(-)
MSMLNSGLSAAKLQLPSVAQDNKHFIKLFIYLSILYFIVRLVYIFIRLRNHKRSPSDFNYVSFTTLPGQVDTVAVDCTHPYLPTITHHKSHYNPVGLPPSDTSTGLVLNALKQGKPWKGGPLYNGTQYSKVTTNHFDVDSFLSVWCYRNRELALKYESVLRHTARVGDFREAFLCPELVLLHGHSDGVENIRDAYTAVKLSCWLMIQEIKLFSKPFEFMDHDEKFDYFLPRFKDILIQPESKWMEWDEEYKRVVSGFDLLNASSHYVSIPRTPFPLGEGRGVVGMGVGVGVETAMGLGDPSNHPPLHHPQSSPGKRGLIRQNSPPRNSVRSRPGSRPSSNSGAAGGGGGGGGDRLDGGGGHGQPG